MANTQQKHFVLVHGACHGAWLWHKLKPLLESSGHRATALDLAASGIHLKKIEDIASLEHYSEPLLKFMASVPPSEKVVLVGHSLGGLNLALAMDTFPENVSVAVFLAALMPDTDHTPSYVLDKLSAETPSHDFWLDTEFSPNTNQSEVPLDDIVRLGPKFCRSKLYQLCSDEDYTLATMLMRPGSLFYEDLSRAKKFTKEGYGSVDKIFIMCGQDLELSVKFQELMIENCGVREVLEIKDADHMAMLSNPRELCSCLLKIVNDQLKPRTATARVGS